MLAVRTGKKKSQRAQSGSHRTGADKQKLSMAPSDRRLDEPKNQATINANSKAIPLMKNNPSTSAFDTSKQYDSIVNDTTTSFLKKAPNGSEIPAEIRMAVNVIDITGQQKVHTIPQVNPIIASFE